MPLISLPVMSSSKPVKVVFRVLSIILILAVSGCSSYPDIKFGSDNPTPQNATSVNLIGTTVNNGTLTDIPMQVGFGVSGPYYEIYFTDPANRAAYKEEGGPDEKLAEAIDAARISVDVAAYSMSLYSIQRALLNAFHRGVLVRVVMESDNMTDKVPQALKDAGIPFIGDRRQGLMHNKFIVIDRTDVWTGSMNFTVSGTYQDDNNLILLKSTKIADDYTVEFEEMFKYDFFGQDAIAETPYPTIEMNGNYIDILFSPDDHVAKKIASILRDAKESIFIMAYSFTANDLGDIIRQKAQAGVLVKGVMDEGQIKTNTGSEFDSFTKAGLPIYPDGNEGLMHSKVIIVDREIVITGSYNFTASAERTNDENVIIFYDKQVAMRYLQEFQRVFDQSKLVLIKP